MAMNWFANSWHKIIIVIIALDRLWNRLYPLYEKADKVEQYLEKRWHERRKGDINMANPIADIQLALQILAEVRTALPILGKSIVDLKQAWVDKTDATKATNDLAQVLTDLEPLINQVLSLVPSAAQSQTSTVTIKPAI